MLAHKTKTLISKTAARGALLACMLVAVVSFFESGCSSISYIKRVAKRESRPGQTAVKDAETVIPARIVAGYFIVEVKWDKRGPWRFIIDTGSTATLLSPEYVNQYAQQNRDSMTSRSISVRAANGSMEKLAPANVSIIQFGSAQFYNVPVLVYDCSELSAHFGMKIDGIIGFPLFRETVFTLDYLQSRLVISRPKKEIAAHAAQGTVIAFNNDRRAPIIPVRLGEETFSALIDTGCDGALVFNPVGLNPVYLQAPRPGASVGTLSGDRAQEIGRLSEPLQIGSYTIVRPIADITDQLSALGSAVLGNFRITFDPRNNKVTFYRGNGAPLQLGAQRSAGMGFAKTPAYWRVVSVVPGSPAETAGVQEGDIVGHINGEPVSRWPLDRYDALVRSAGQITYTFVLGSVETARELAVFDLVR